MNGLLNPAGGLRYHWAAFRRRQQWQGFKNELNTWLTEWNPRSEFAVLVGPSAGYLLEDSFLKKFKRIEAWDIDPLAPMLFKKQHPEIEVTWKKKDWFREYLNAGKKPNLNTAYVFTGILGQLPFLTKDEGDFDEIFKTLQEFLSDVPFLSFHDRFVSDEPFREPSPVALRTERQQDSHAVVSHFWGADARTVSEFDLGKLHLLSKSFFCGAWNIRKDQNHVVEGIRSL